MATHQEHVRSLKLSGWTINLFCIRGRERFAGLEGSRLPGFRGVGFRGHFDRSPRVEADRHFGTELSGDLVKQRRGLYAKSSVRDGVGGRSWAARKCVNSPTADLDTGSRVLRTQFQQLTQNLLLRSYGLPDHL